MVITAFSSPPICLPVCWMKKGCDSEWCVCKIGFSDCETAYVRETKKQHRYE